METPEEKKARKRSHIVTYITVFTMSTGITIVLGGIWPYLQELVPGIKKDKLGPVIAMNPLISIFAAPLMGYLGNKLGSVRILCLITVAVYIVGNLLYGLLGLMGDYAYTGMFIARILTGFGSANITLCRTYITQSTTMDERTASLSYLSLAQTLGFVFGPVIQALSSLIFPSEIEVLTHQGFDLDMYTFAAFIAALLGVVNFILYIPYYFQEINIMKRGINGKKGASVRLPNPDPLATVAIIFGFISCNFTLIITQSMATPMVMDLYGWDRTYAVVTVGLVNSGGAMLTVSMFVVVNLLLKRYDERKIMFILGFIPFTIGVILYLPFFGDKIPIQTQCYKNMSVKNETSSWLTTDNSSDLINPVREFYDDSKLSLLDKDIPGNQYANSDSLVKKVNNTDFFCSEKYECACGCPADIQPWCTDSKTIPPLQLLAAYLIIAGSFAACSAVMQGLWSKIAGPRPQGVWMALMTTVGSLARASGPIYVSNVYVVNGAMLTFGIIVIMLIISIIGLLLVYKKLIALKPIEDDNSYEL